jgi:hypothetical protein
VTPLREEIAYMAGRGVERLTGDYREMYIFVRDRTDNPTTFLGIGLLEGALRLLGHGAGYVSQRLLTVRMEALNADEEDALHRYLLAVVADEPGMDPREYSTRLTSELVFLGIVYALRKGGMPYGDIDKLVSFDVVDCSVGYYEATRRARCVGGQGKLHLACDGSHFRLMAAQGSIRADAIQQRIAVPIPQEVRE